ncbi:deoxycytidylate deaminase [Shewanella oncorhynchi]|uniref:deoxycytidylate deaminase n=1 Tax=Shewanella TaxID=22 RepID=UPI0021DA47EE|nr:deoxycytidylate deaminase [Shewanella sp. SM69]MCU8039368.1 deoxycytidylate deaminase [Shewanella sp. SM69]
MTRKKESLAIDKIFEEISDFLIIGLTGRTGSGCSTSAKILSAESLDLPDPGQSHFVGNEQRKYRIIKKYIEKNRKPFEWLQVRTIITSYILRLNFSSFCMLVSDILNVELSLVSEHLADFKIEYIKSSDRVNSYFEKDVNTVESLNAGKLECYDMFFKWLPDFSNELKSRLLGIQSGGYTKIYQVVGDNIRSSGTANIKEFNQNFIFSFPTMINRIIKSARYVCSMDAKPCNIVVDAIRNPYEAVYLRDRYSGFYLMSVNTDNDNRLKYLMESHKFTSSQIKELDSKEYPEKLSGYNKYISQNIQKCIELADIHINNPRENQFGHSELRAQLAWYVALMLHPGLVMPTSTESCMQIAYSVKQNSGCISRQVGAVVTDERYSVKAVGWNNTAEGQVPCLLRSAEDLLNGFDEAAYSKYEKNNIEFRDVLHEKFNLIRRYSHLDGRNLSFCFKDLQNQVEQKKNQVHTRSLHAEENAFLQISKNGGQGVKGGILFTTASPCELCAKKAYQLGISKVVFIDPYPGIATPHIIFCGAHPPKLELFRGALGRAFYQLYQPIMPYKDELEVLLDIKGGVDKKDITIRRLKTEAEILTSENENLKETIMKLQLTISSEK